MEKFYQNNLNYIRQHHLDKICVVIAKITPYLTAALYALTLLILFINHSSKLLLTIIKPLSSFLIVTLIRKLYNRPRPCVVFNIEPLVDHKTDEHFQVRHTVKCFYDCFCTFEYFITTWHYFFNHCLPCWFITYFLWCTFCK